MGLLHWWQLQWISSFSFRVTPPHLLVNAPFVGGAIAAALAGQMLKLEGHL